MSASICWEPAGKKVNSIPVAAPQRLIGELDNAGLGNIHNGGIVLSAEHLPVLRGMMAVFGGVNPQNPYWHIINAIQSYKEIRLWAVY